MDSIDPSLIRTTEPPLYPSPTNVLTSLSIPFSTTQLHYKKSKRTHKCLSFSATMSSSEEIAKKAKAAFEASQLISASERIKTLRAIRKELKARKEDILAANREDLEVIPLLF